MKATDKISKYCTYGEAIASQEATRRGLENIPDEQQLEAMKFVATEVFDKVREFLGKPLRSSSFFRSKTLNQKMPGTSTTSQHSKGEAVDMVCDGENKKIFDYIWGNLEFDQLIWEYGTEKEPAWVHCSRVAGRKNRNQVLRCTLGPNKKPVYAAFTLYKRPEKLA